MEQLLLTAQFLNGAYDFQHVCKPKGSINSVNVENFSSSINNIFTCLKLNYDHSFVVYATQLHEFLLHEFLKFCFHKV